MTTWKEFLSERHVPKISGDRKSRMDLMLLEAADRLREADSRYFRARLSGRNMWRLLRDFRRSTVFLDIETTGISVRSPVTVVGIYDGTRTHSLIRGQTLTGHGLESILSSAGLVVTYNGKGFDLPVLRAQFPGHVPDVPHIDLRHVLARLGHRGGLKAIERQLGISRDHRVEMMTGADAVYLWRLWEKNGKGNALDLLLEYNRADCENLRTLADYAYERMKRETYIRVARGKP